MSSNGNNLPDPRGLAINDLSKVPGHFVPLLVFGIPYHGDLIRVLLPVDLLDLPVMFSK
ncbi:MAG: hypothetical protein M1393_02200 [Candidatus Thermoplasmatota archaeon]|nr:hypothetical protein [Candidatus Thermoplasmatota archaeon]MDA8144311.1 hypothetical protein [Thermoplasmatales archaeon]